MVFRCPATHGAGRQVACRSGSSSSSSRNGPAREAGSSSSSSNSHASRRQVLSMGLAVASWLGSGAADALQGPAGNLRVMPDGFDLLSPNQPTVSAAAEQQLGFVDADGDGVVSLQEMQRNLPAVRNVPDQEYLQYLHRLYDMDADGKVTREEFLKSTALEACVSEDEVSEALFQVFDKNNNQFVDLQEFQAAWGSQPGSSDAAITRWLFRKADLTGDNNGLLDEVEFVKSMNMMRMLYTD